MRAIRWALALILSFSLAAPPVSLAQGRGHGPGGNSKVEKVEKRPDQAQKKQKKQNKAAKAKKAKERKDQKKNQAKARGRGHRAEAKPRGDEARERRAEVRRNRAERLAERAREAREARAERREPRREAQGERREARAERREARTEAQAERREARREADRRDRPVPARLIEELRREDERIRAQRRERRAELERSRRGPLRDRRGGDGAMRFRGLDENRDGRISRREWRGNDVSFRNHDWNGDGVLAGAEVAPGGKRPRVARRADRLEPRDRLERLDRLGDADRVRRVPRDRPVLRFRTDALGHRVAVTPQPLVTRLDRAFAVNQRLWLDRRQVPVFPDRTRDDVMVVDFGLDVDDELDLFALPLTLMLTDALVGDVDVVVRTERFAAFDRDVDGFVSPAEWPAGRRSLGRLDRDGDLLLVREELFVDDRLVVVDRDRFLLFEALDLDEDGLVAPWEWPGSVDSFFFRDMNADGAINLDEFLGLEAEVEVRDMGFDVLDFDRDGEVRRVEWVGDPVRFARLDRNDDGVVGRWEFGVGWILGA